MCSRRRSAKPRRLELRSITSTATQNLGWALHRLGNEERALSLLEASVAAFAAQGNQRLRGFSHVLVARVLLDRDLGGALVAARQALAFAESAPPLRITALAVMAIIHARLGEWDAGVVAAREAAAGLEAHGVEEAEGFVRLACIDALSAGGETAEATTLRKRARERVSERAEAIHRPEWRQAFLAVSEHAAVMNPQS